jgi:MOSC domain-containing protein YiiM
MAPQDKLRLIANQGIEGDHHLGRSRRQVLLIEAETLEELSLLPGQLRENIVVSGIALAGAPRGSLLQVGNAQLEVTMDCDPCPFVETIRAGLLQEIDGRRGTLARVVVGGLVATGEPIKHLE